MIGPVVLVCKQQHKGAEPVWDLQLALSRAQEITYQGKDVDAFGNPLSTNMSGQAFLLRFS